MSKIGNIAKKVVGMQTVKIDDVIAQYGGVVTINGLSYATYKGTQIPVFSFIEGEGTAFWGGCKKLRELAQALEEEFDGDLRAINEEFRHTGVKVKLSPLTKTNGGNPYRPVSIIGEVDFTQVTELDDADEPEGEIDAETGEVVQPF